MSAREWKPGDVAMVTLDGLEPQRAWVGIDGCWEGEDGDHVHTSRHDLVLDARPLVVIDPESVADVNRLAFAYESLRDMGAALRSLVEPPRPAEPTTWGVVEASCVHSEERRKWIHHDDGNWWPAEKYGDATARLDNGRDPRLPDDWDSLLQPVVIREGVTA